MIFIEHISDVLEHLAHELVLVEFKGLEKYYDKFDETIDVSVVESIVLSLLTVGVKQSSLNTCLHHNLAEAE